MFWKYIITLIFSFIIPPFAFAQVSPVTQAPSPSQSTVRLVADVNLQDCSYTQASSTDQLITIVCNITNKLGNQGDIRYGINLVKKTGNIQEIVDSKIYDEVLSLNLNQTISKKIEYTPPSYLEGEFELRGILKTSDGLPLATNIIGTITLKSTLSYVEIQSSTCFLHMSGTTTPYTIRQGVDIDATETLLGSCMAQSHFTKEMTVTPSFTTYRRSIFGEITPDSKDVQTPITFKANEEKTISFVVPKAVEPQAYDTVLSLIAEDGSVVSNPVAIHYVLRGPSATIQNVLLDKDVYAKGDIAKVSVLWAGSADTFPGSRKQETEAKVSSVVISIKDGSNNLCSEEDTFPVPSNKAEQNVPTEYALSITSSCTNPQVIAKIVDTTGKTLADKTISVTSAPTQEKNTQGNVWMQNLIKYGWVIVLPFVVWGIVLFVRRRRTI